MITAIKTWLTENAQITETLLLIIPNALILIAFAVLTLRSVFKKDYNFHKRCWYLPLCCGIIVVEYSVLALLGRGNTLALASLGLTLITFSFSFAFPVRKTVKTDEPVKFVRYLDQKIKEEKELAQKERPLTEKLSLEKRESKTPKAELDFSHVRNVIARLNYFGLSTQDKKTVKDLEMSVLEAERGDDSTALKQKINDGLGALLKIMSKYGA